MMREITGKEPKIWGKSIIGFGKYSYQRKNGQEFEWFNVGLSPAKAHLSIYVMYDINTEPKLLERLGKHKTGKGCLYIKSLADVELDALKEIIEKSAGSSSSRDKEPPRGLFVFALFCFVLLCHLLRLWRVLFGICLTPAPSTPSFHEMYSAAP